MKKIIFFISLICFFSLNVFANERKQNLDQLFRDLKSSNTSSAYKIEQKIWKQWSTHPYDKKLTLLLANGTDAVNNNRLLEAIEIFTEVIKIDPNWAEAWNKRATVLYLVGRYQSSQNDIEKVLELEKRHFGALAGQGLVNIKLKNYEKAIKSYEKALEIYPSMRSPEIMIKEIEALIKQDLI
tara:strand:- start:436 stop:984 length:549 start_codon:yes stop_codon:yes gene_type:complete